MILFLAAFLIGCGGNSGGTSAATPASVPPEDVWLQQNAHPISTSDPANTDYSDLQAFGDAVGNARIVLLGEESHGSGTTFDMKTRLVKYLHEQKGFDVLILETNFFVGNRIWQLAQTGQKVDDLAPNNIFYMYSKSAQGRNVLQYADSQRTTSNPLIVTAADSAAVGATDSVTDFFPLLESFLSGRSSPTLASSNWAIYKNLALNALFPYPPTLTNPPQNQIDAFNAVSDSLVGELCGPQPDTYVFPNSPSFWCRTVKSLRAQADPTFNPSVISTRDIESAANAQWLLDHAYPGHKFIFWGAIIHVGRYDAPWVASPSMATEMALNYGSQMYSVNMTASSGTDLDYVDLSTYTIPGDEQGSVEDVLHQVNQPVLFVDARNTSPPGSLFDMLAKNWGFTYVPNFLNSLGTAYDGLFYFQTNYPATMNR